MSAPGRRVGLLAGGGSVPREIADSLAARRVPVLVVALDGEADADFAPHATERVNWGQIGRMVSLFRTRGVTDIVIVGRVKRPDLKRIRTDLGFYMALPDIWRIVRAGGDDAVLREVVRFFEARGFRVAGPADVAPELVVREGPMGRVAPRPDDESDIATGLALVAELGPLDIGQGVVVARGEIEAIEGVEGTDRMLERVAQMRRERGPRIGGVLIKRPKPGQELRVDLPAIGPDTARRAAEAGLGGIAVMAGRTLAAERAELQRRADALGVFVVGVPPDRSETTGEDPATRVRAALPDFDLDMHAGRAPTGPTRESIAKGLAVIATLAPRGLGQAVAVARRHVLAVEAAEGALALATRVAGQRQWGGSRRVGVLVLAPGAEVSPRVMAAAAAAGLEGVVVSGRGTHDSVALAEAAGASGRHGLFLASATQRDGRDAA